MSKQVTLLRVCGASPENLNQEKAVLFESINKINNILYNDNIQLKMVKWKTDSIFGTENDSDNRINYDDYDIFIGIIWKKLSVSNKKEKSEVLNEFIEVIDHFKAYPKDSVVMFYFSEVPIRPKDIDIEQLNLINQFKIKLSELGISYWEYERIDEFAALINENLKNQTKEWGKNWGINQYDKKFDYSKWVSVSNDITLVEDPEEDYGFLDLIEIGQENFEKLTGVLGRITDATETLGEKVGESGAEIERIQSNNPDIRKTKSILKRTAEDMEHFVKLVEPEIPIFKTTFSTGINALVQAATISNEIQQEENENNILAAFNSAQNMKESIKNSRKSIITFREAVYNLPRLTKDINIAKKHIVSTLDKLINELCVAEIIASDAENNLEKIIQI